MWEKHTLARREIKIIWIYTNIKRLCVNIVERLEPSRTYTMKLFAKIVRTLYSQKSPPYMFDWVLNLSLCVRVQFLLQLFCTKLVGDYMIPFDQDEISVVFCRDPGSAKKSS